MDWREVKIVYSGVLPITIWVYLLVHMPVVWCLEPRTDDIVERTAFQRCRETVTAQQACVWNSDSNFKALEDSYWCRVAEYRYDEVIEASTIIVVKILTPPLKKAGWLFQDDTILSTKKKYRIRGLDLVEPVLSNIDNWIMILLIQ